MAGKESEVSTPLLENILNQPNALREIGKYQFGEGYHALREAAQLLRGKKRILLTGMGGSHCACAPFYYGLAGRGYPVTSVETSEFLYFLPHLADSDTAVVLVSRSGESVEVVRLIPKLKASGAAVLGVVNVPDSTVAAEASHKILMNSPADQLVAIQTYIATLVVFALLEAAIFGELDQAKSDLEKAADLLAGLVPECITASEQWTEFLQGDHPLYLLGRGSALGTVSEGVLLMHETAKSPAVGMSAAQFRHGPVEVTDSRFRGIVIGTQPATAQLDAALVDDLSRMGGQIRWIGPEVDGANLTPLMRWPADIPARFAAVFETVPLQMAAYRKAELHGITPGSFRWAPAVTTSEAGFAFGGSR
jgi:glucosamine--fructose-6-phosphate aminotransferase (isomerizing)